jgi:hypothetical protein
MFRFSKITTLFTLLAYLMGFGALILYADGVYKRKRSITSVYLPFFVLGSLLNLCLQIINYSQTHRR